jgi:hypothetical protein
VRGGPGLTQCVYCQTKSATTRDHVIPKCLFVLPLPPNLVTVRVCESCNEGKSRDDDFLRDYLVTDFAGSTSPTADALLKGKVRRSAKRNSSEVARAVFRLAKEKPFYTKGGIFLGNFIQAPLESSRFDRIFRRVIGGLYHYYTGGALIPVDYPIRVLRIMPWEMDSAWDRFSRLHLNRCGPFGDVFVGACARVKEDVRSTMWVMTFYQRVHFFVESFNPDLGAPVSD